MACLHFPIPTLCFFHLLLFYFASYCSSFAPLCNHDQSSALLHFKNSFHLDSSASVYEHSYPRTKSWRNGTNCCLWDGVTCDTMSGHVIGLDLSSSWLYGKFHLNNTLFQLMYLQKLNLADNNFLGSPIFYEFGELVTLTHLNLSFSEFSDEIPSKISQLSKLVSLDFSKNLGLRLEPSTWKKLIQNATGLRELNLNNVNMSSIRPSSLSLLTNFSSSLVFLHLSSTELKGDLANDILFLPNLQELDLFGNNFQGSNIPSSFWNFTQLTYLMLNSNNFSGEISSLLSNLQHLTYLDLSINNFSGEISSLLSNFEHLNHLDLSTNNFHGEIPSLLSNFEHLNHLDLSTNNFHGEIPSLLSNLQHLTYFRLSRNNFIGQIPDIFSHLNKLVVFDLSENNLGGQMPPSLFHLTQLSSLDCSYNKLVGPIPHNINGFPNLEELDLSNNLLNGTMPSWCFSLPSLFYLSLNRNQLTGNIVEFSAYSMTRLYLSHNNLQGNIPNSMSHLVNLTDLSLSSNNLSGLINFHKFSKLQNLEYLDISNNNFLSFNFNNSVDYIIPNLNILDLSSCNTHYFPKFLAQLQNLRSLYLSNNNIHGSIPSWFNHIGNGSLLSLGLSHNFLTSVEHLPWANIQFVDLSSNMLIGDIPNWFNHIGNSSLSLLDLSFNMLTGDIPSAICNASSLIILNLSHNNLTGMIPRCLATFSSLLVLDIQMNNLQGSIPGNFSKRNIMEIIKLNGNHLGGPLPQSLAHNKQLQILDLGDNDLEGTFPCWLEVLQELQVLILRGNKFHGTISRCKSKYPFPELRIFDISNNYFSGPLPATYIEEFKGMRNVNDDAIDLRYMEIKNLSYYYNDSIVLTMKGSYIELERILTTFTTIDLSSNRFEGEIPTIIGRLYALKGLNLSHNIINGTIPQSLGNLTKLEWLDLSFNKLTGQIPVALTNLNFLSLLNVSHNQLVGMIPEGKQFNTFPNDSYEGNSGLCGFPLSKKCNADGGAKLPSPFILQQEEKFGFGWKVVALGYGCGMIFGLLMGCIVFSTGKPEWLVKIVEGEQIKQAKRPRKRAHTNP